MVDAPVEAIRRAQEAFASGGVGVVPTDTVYGLAAALDSPAGVDRLYEVKRRPRSQPCQVMIYSRELLDALVADLPGPVAAVVERLLPGPVTCIVRDPSRHFSAAAGDTPGSVGVRAPRVGPGLADLRVPLVATSANHPGGADPATLSEVPSDLRALLDVEIDAGVLPGTASAVVDLRRVAADGVAELLREGENTQAITDALAEAGVELH